MTAESLIANLRALKKLAQSGDDKAAVDYYHIRQFHVAADAGIPSYFSREQRKEVKLGRHRDLIAIGLGVHAGRFVTQRRTSQ